MKFSGTSVHRPVKTYKTIQLEGNKLWNLIPCLCNPLMWLYLAERQCGPRNGERGSEFVILVGESGVGGRGWSPKQITVGTDPAIVTLPKSRLIMPLIPATWQGEATLGAERPQNSYGSKRKGKEASYVALFQWLDECQWSEGGGTEPWGIKKTWKRHRLPEHVLCQGSPELIHLNHQGKTESSKTSVIDNILGGKKATKCDMSMIKKKAKMPILHLSCLWWESCRTLTNISWLVACQYDAATKKKKKKNSKMDKFFLTFNFTKRFENSVAYSVTWTWLMWGNRYITVTFQGVLISNKTGAHLFSSQSLSTDKLLRQSAFLTFSCQSLRTIYLTDHPHYNLEAMLKQPRKFWASSSLCCTTDVILSIEWVMQHLHIV